MIGGDGPLSSEKILQKKRSGHIGEGKKGDINNELFLGGGPKKKNQHLPVREKEHLKKN